MNTWNVRNCLWFTVIISKYKYFFILTHSFNNYFFLSLISVRLPTFWNVFFCFQVNVLRGIYEYNSSWNMPKKRRQRSIPHAWLNSTRKRTIIVIHFFASLWNKVTFVIEYKYRYIIIFKTQKEWILFRM